ncbi:ABC transporter substrate-binding protein [Microvirga terricola]|uniref:Probable sugar-binding periplasmic protein n=1 Tax=Microvirga terricola TaxID=2719797 RepID=A0ABX0VB91_9HYPH|nr:ABC transporter substrate-binding protein [Microvirga terricola]NIX75072.1 carbohydrate ABC transporter substrate-binding protein [Microvirga terricola]
MRPLHAKTLVRRAGQMLATASVAVAALACANAASAQTLTIESWRNDDADVWNSQIIPAFNKKFPNIKVQFKADPPTEYNAALNARLTGGTAGDLITCRPFDASLDLFKKGQLISVNEVKGIENFSDVAKSAWSTDDGKTTFCMPMASVIHGFIYNKPIFDELKLAPPKTMSEFYAVLDKIKAHGKYTPLAMGTADQWEAATMGFQNIGVNYWKGEEGRKALIEGKQKFTDPAYIQTFSELAKWAPYMGKGYQSQKYPDTQNLFALGRAAIYPAGSWDVPIFRKQADFEFDAFAPPVPDGQGKCYISDHTDIALGINAKSKNVEAAKTFLSWIATSEFADIYANALPGFFPLSKEKVTVKDPVAAKFVGWRSTCDSSIRNSYQILSRGTPNLENELWNVSAQVLNGTMKPEEAAKKAEDGLAGWYEPHKK